MPGANDTLSFAVYHPSGIRSLGESVELDIVHPIVFQSNQTGGQTSVTVYSVITIRYVVDGGNRSIGELGFTNDTAHQSYAFTVRNLPLDRWSVIIRNPYNDLAALGFSPGTTLKTSFYYKGLSILPPSEYENGGPIQMFYDSFSLLTYGPTSLP